MLKDKVRKIVETIKLKSMKYDEINEIDMF